MRKTQCILTCNALRVLFSLRFCRTFMMYCLRFTKSVLRTMTKPFTARPYQVCVIFHYFCYGLTSSLQFKILTNFWRELQIARIIGESGSFFLSCLSKSLVSALSCGSSRLTDSNSVLVSLVKDCPNCRVLSFFTTRNAFPLLLWCSARTSVRRQHFFYKLDLHD